MNALAALPTPIVECCTAAFQVNLVGDLSGITEGGRTPSALKHGGSGIWSLHFASKQPLSPDLQYGHVGSAQAGGTGNAIPETVGIDRVRLTLGCWWRIAIPTKLAEWEFGKACESSAS